MPVIEDESMYPVILSALTHPTPLIENQVIPAQTAFLNFEELVTFVTLRY